MSKALDQAPFLVIPSITLHTDELYSYGRLEWIGCSHKVHRNSLKNLENNEHKNKLSKRSVIKIERIVKFMVCNSAKKTAYNYKTQSRFTFKINFITLTLPSKQSESDTDFKHKYLNQFLIEAKKKWNLINYVWKAERQKNGNIHIHIVSDVFIPWLELRNVWNRILNKENYIEEYYKKWKHDNPNSTDIHSIKESEKIMGYMSKYITKNVTGCEMKGNIWRCSANLSKVKGIREDVSIELNEELQRLSKDIKVRRIDGDYFSGFYFNHTVITSKLYPELFNLMKVYKDSIYQKKNISIWNDQ